MGADSHLILQIYLPTQVVKLNKSRDLVRIMTDDKNYESKNIGRSTIDHWRENFDDRDNTTNSVQYNNKSGNLIHKAIVKSGVQFIIQMSKFCTAETNVWWIHHPYSFNKILSLFLQTTSE